MLELVVLAAATLLLSGALVDHYASPGTTILIRSLAVVSFWLGFGGVVLLPVDLSRTRRLGTDDDDVVEVNDTYVPWSVTYWSTFCLAWTVLPIVREILYSGRFSLSARVRGGLRSWLLGNAILVTISLVLVVALAIKLRSWRVVPILMAVGNTYGLLLVSLLLGYGLVDVPRRFWRKSSPESELRRTRIVATVADEALFEAVWELQDCEDAIDAAVRAAKISAEEDVEPGAAFGATTPRRSVETMPYADCVEELERQRNLTAVLDAELQNRRTKRPSSRSSSLSSPSSPDSAGSDGSAEPFTSSVPTVDDLAQLSARLKLAQARLVSAEQRWVEIVDAHATYSALVDRDDLTYPVRDASFATWAGKRDHARAVLRYFWMSRIRTLFYRLLCVCAAGLSATLLWSEATMVLPFNVSPFALALEIFDEDHLENSLFFMIAALVPLVYASVCVYTSLFKVSIFGPNCLRGWKQSPGVALLFNAQYLIRMQFPLGYNYLMMLKIDTSSTNCAFSKVMSDMSTVPFFGTSFSIYAPLLIIALCAFTLYNGYARLLALMGFQHEDSVLMGDRETLDHQLNEGIVLLSRNQRRQGRMRRGGVVDGTDDDDSDSDSGEGENTNWWYNVVV